MIASGNATVNEVVRNEVRVLQDLLAATGREPSSFPVGKRVYIAVDRDRARAQRRLGEWFVSYYGDLISHYDAAHMAERVAIWGDAQECVDRLAEIVSAGARRLLLNLVFDELEQLAALTTRVVPKL